MVSSALVACANGEKAPEISMESTSPTSTSVAPELHGRRFCDDMAEPIQVGRITDPELVEISGVVASRRHEGVFWVHNDSGDSARIFAISLTGERLGEFRIDGIDAFDFEDITLIDTQDVYADELVIADIGDNAAERDSVFLTYLAEPDLPADPAQPVHITEFAWTEYEYDDGPRDAESVFVDPETSEVVIISKDYFDTQSLYRPGKQVDSKVAPISRVAPVELGEGQIATSADADASAVLVRTYTDVLVFERSYGETTAEALERKPCVAPSAKEKQGEAIALLADGSGYLTISEGLNAPIWLVSVR